jgi:tetratricopeptide (TPR) repeat protein
MKKILKLLCTWLLISLAWSCFTKESYKQRGISAYKEKKYRIAQKHLQFHLRYQPKDHQANYWLGKTMLALNQKQQALSYLKKAQKEKPLYFFANWELGRIYLISKQYQKAESHLFAALGQAPNEYQAQVNGRIGDLYFIQGYFEPAHKFYKRALEAGSQRPLVFYNQAAIYKHQKKIRQSILLLEQFLKLTNPPLLQKKFKPARKQARLTLLELKAKVE